MSIQILYKQTEAQMISVVDSHTEGEPTRVVIAGGPEFKPQPLQIAGKNFALTTTTFGAP